MKFSHRDPSYSGWKKSTRSDGGSNCVQVGWHLDGSTVGVADSKAGDSGPILSYSRASWGRFVSGVKADRIG